MRGITALLVLAATSACGGGGGSPLPTGPSPVAANVEFRYQAVASTEAQTAQAFECTGVARIYPSWWGFTHAMMIPSGEGEWAALFEDVPVGSQSVRVEPPAGCTSLTLVANRTELSMMGDGAFVLTVHPDGSVTR